MNLYPIILSTSILGGIVITIWGWQVMKKSQKIKQWPCVEGMIEKSESSSETDDLLPNIVFSYSVASQEYHHHFEFPPDTNPLPEFSEAYVKKYAVGTIVPVYYHPQNPETATLEPGTKGDWMIVALGVLMTVVGIASFLLA